MTKCTRYLQTGIYPSNFDVHWKVKKTRSSIEFSNSIFIKFYFKAFWHRHFFQNTLAY